MTEMSVEETAVIILREAVPTGGEAFLIRSSSFQSPSSSLKFIRHHVVRAQEKLEDIKDELQKYSIVTHTRFVKLARRPEAMDPFVISLPSRQMVSRIVRSINATCSPSRSCNEKSRKRAVELTTQTQ